MHEGEVSTKLGLPGIPAVSEELAVLKILMLAEYTGARIHITHVSTGRSVDLIAEYQQRGVKVSAETCPQYISLTDEACLGYNTMAKMYPPLRPASDVKALIEGLRTGVLTVIATDHAPHTQFEKLQPFHLATKGTVGLETSFAVSYTHLVKKKKLTLPQLIEKMTINPAHVVGIDKGTLAKGADADITILDTEKTWTADIDAMQTKGGNSVFNGKKLTGKAQHVFVGGVQKVRDGEII
jgi:dihydroorotase